MIHYMQMYQKECRITGARVHNLKNISVAFPRNKMVVITGVSGSGKSSLAFDTVYAEGQRRYMESLSAYARQFLDQLDKPDVDRIEGLSPAISIDQKSGSKNPRSTVGTITEIHDYFRLLFQAIGIPHCPHCHTPIQKKTIQEIHATLLEQAQENDTLIIIAPLVEHKKGSAQTLFKSLLAKGFRRVRINDVMTRLDEPLTLAKTKKHRIDLVVDKVRFCDDNHTRLFESLEVASKEGNGRLLVINSTQECEQLFSENHACLTCTYSLPELSARLFSFNSPLGACDTCNGLGSYLDFNPDLVLTSRTQPLLQSLCTLINRQDALCMKLDTIMHEHGINPKLSYTALSPAQRALIFYGTPAVDITTASTCHTVAANTYWDGLLPTLRRQYTRVYSENRRFYYRSFMSPRTCPSCHGDRLSSTARHVYVHTYSLPVLSRLPIAALLSLFITLPFTPQETTIIQQIKQEITHRLTFLNNVGLGYLSLMRRASTLSGGEFQRIRLATQIGSALTGVLYVLDEPSIGLHQRDNERLIATLKTLRDLGNTLLIVEHDEAMIQAADHIIEIGPGAGQKGGTISFSGSQAAFKKTRCLTALYLTGKKRISIPLKRRTLNAQAQLTLAGVTAHNLDNITVSFPIGLLTCVTGVSGSGKSTLLYTVLHRALMRHFHDSKEQPGAYDSLTGLDHIDTVITIDQSPIGRTPRSNPVTYIGVFTAIRELFSQTPEAKIRGYKPGRFSFNVAGGRCDACQGDGVCKIEMHFLSDVYVTCDICKGKRYNSETLMVKYKGYTINDVLAMTVDTACDLFKAIPTIYNKLSVLQSVGLGYITCGQAATTLSGGEAQRIKLAKELSKRQTGKTLYLLDEPTTGLHFQDIHCLLDVLHTLVDQGNTMIIIEHNLDVIKTADHVIDIGPEGGDKGGQLIAAGTPEAVAACAHSHTGQWLKPLLSH